MLGMSPTTSAPKSVPAATIAFSFQLMTRAEPPAMVIDTIKSLLRIKSVHDEILIIDNNHTDKALYEPLETFCNALDAEHKVRFYHIDSIAGYKAGALNRALAWMDKRCSHIVVVDSDYEALAHARETMVQAIEAHPEHTLLQFPQFYRDTALGDVHSELNHYFNYHLYRESNRTRALSTGTYAVIRRTHLIHVGGWSGASLTEDAQMGILMHQRGMRSAFIPTVIATGLLPNTLADLLNQRRRWVYGNMQILCRYVAEPVWRRLRGQPQPTAAHIHMPSVTHDADERKRYQWAHLSQLSAWVNFTGLLMWVHAATVMVLLLSLILGNVHTSLLSILAAVYTGYAVFLGRRLWAYLHDQAPLNSQVDSGYQHNLRARVRAWLMHLNFWELGALCWLPVLWGRQKPFVCTPKQKQDQTRTALFHANSAALPKLLLVLNALTAFLVAPFSALSSPVLFACALTVLGLKLLAAKVAFSNYGFAQTAPTQTAVDKPTIRKPAVTPIAAMTDPVINKVSAPSTVSFDNKKTVNF
ncbi:hypothetical protein GCM10009129_22510 [Psychrobacter aestuarii]|uniref:Glycosyltransferase 2-like domain-containing protein n=2 Tax=Psychrobacter aestuarii TaxID=556327 RepID=A0ABN0W3L9_9GAMM